MSYNVDYGSLSGLQGQIGAAVSGWSQGLSGLMGKEQALLSSTNIAGNSADRLKEYLNAVYSFADSSFSMLIALYQQNFMLYTDAYYQQIDASRETRIGESELSERRSDMADKKSEFANLAMEIEKQLGSASSLVTLTTPDFNELDTEFGDVLSFLDDLNNDINGLESAHTTGDFGEIDQLLDRIKAYIKEVYNLNQDFKTNFTIQNFAALASVPGLIAAMDSAYNRMVDQQSAVEDAAKRLEKRIEQEQEELRKRERNAKIAKAAVGIIATVVSAACVATGVGTLLVPVVCGITKASFNAAADQYVKNGWNTDQWDTAYIGKEAVKGGFTSMVTALLPPGTGPVVKATVSGLNSALWGGVDNAYEQLTTTGTISDTNAIFFDAAKSGVSGFTGSLVSNVVSDSVEKLPIGFGLDKYSNPSNDVKHYVGKFVTGAASEVTSGIAERTTTTTVETGFDVVKNITEGESALKDIDLVDRYKDVASFENITNDFVKGGVKEAVSSYYSERTPDPKTGLTPIIQAKLGYETDPETGLTGVVQDSLSHIVDEDQFNDVLGGMEERNPSTGAGAAYPPTLGAEAETPDYSRTSLTPSEEALVREMEENGEFDISPKDLGPAHYSSDMKPLTEKPIEIEFTANTDRYTEEQFISQLDGQEEGLNFSTVADVVDNREAFLANGRADSAEVQNNYRIGIVETIIDERGEAEIADRMKANPGMSYDEASKQVDWNQLRQEAEAEVDGKDALHDPDQNAGGDPSNVHGLGSSSVNRSIGSQWGNGRAAELYQKILDATAGMSREEMEHTRLNVRLTYKVKGTT